MRSLLGALAVAGCAVSLLSRTVAAEPPQPTEARLLSKIIPALRAKPALKADLAMVRFYAEVFGGTELDVPMGSSLETLGPGGENGARVRSERAIAGLDCEGSSSSQLKAATALLKEYESVLPVTLRAYAIGIQGRREEAAELFATWGEGLLDAGPCPSEHPMNSSKRVGDLELAIRCVRINAPKRDVSSLMKKRERAMSCLRNNHAVG